LPFSFENSGFVEEVQRTDTEPVERVGKLRHEKAEKGQSLQEQLHE